MDELSAEHLLSRSPKEAVHRKFSTIIKSLSPELAPDTSSHFLSGATLIPIADANGSVVNTSDSLVAKE